MIRTITEVRLWKHAAIFAALAFFVACGDARVNSTFSPDDDNQRPGTTGSPPSSQPGGGGPGTGPDDGGGDPDAADRCVLIPGSGGQVTTQVMQFTELEVFVYSLDTGDPMGNVPVTFLIDADSEVDAQLSARSTLSSGDTGRASVRARAGQDPGRVKIIARADCARPLELNLDISQVPMGHLEVHLTYPQASIYPVQPFEVHVYNSLDFQCNERRSPRGRPMIGDPVELQSLFSYAEVNNLVVGDTYTVVAFGIGRWGEDAAYGCADAIRVMADATTEVQIDLRLEPLDPAGVYDVATKWDFTNAIVESGPIGALFGEILLIIRDPGAGLYEFIMNRIRDYVGGLVATVVDTFLRLTGLTNLIQDGINSLIRNNPTLSSIWVVLEDVSQIFNNLEVSSMMEIGKMFGDYEVFGVDTWTGIVLYWRLPCCWPDCRVIPEDCDGNPIVFDPDEIGFVQAEWTGRITGYDNLTIDRHPVNLNYGLIILYVLEHLMFPAITGLPAPVTITDFVSWLVGCNSLADWIVGSGRDCRCAIGVCICKNDIIGICTGFIDLVFGSILRNFIAGLRFDSAIDNRGQCTLINENHILDVEYLRDGEYFPILNIGGVNAAIAATFEAVKRGYVPE